MANGNRGTAQALASQPKQPDPSERPRPVHEVRLGRVKAAVWANDTEHGVRHSVSVCRVYKDGQGKWRTTDSFGRDDLLLLSKVLDRAHSWICDATNNVDVPF